MLQTGLKDEGSYWQQQEDEVETENMAGVCTVSVFFGQVPEVMSSDPMFQVCRFPKTLHIYFERAMNDGKKNNIQLTSDVTLTDHQHSCRKPKKIIS